MSTRILDGEYDGSATAACLVDSVTGQAFGPLFDDGFEAEAYLDWFGGDPRALPPVELAHSIATFRVEREAGVA